MEVQFFKEYHVDMTVLDPSGRPWDSTPKRYIITTSHRVRHDPVLNGTIEQAQLNQSRVYDQVLEHFDRHAAFPFQAPAGKPSLCKWITSMRRRDQNFRNIPVALARGAASQARLAWLTKDSFEQDKAGTILDEQEKEDAVRRGEAPHPNDILDEQERKKHEPSPRLVRLWSKEPKPNRSRGQARSALRLLVPCTPVRERIWNDHDERHERKAVPGKWHLPGLGQLELLAQDQIPAGADIRSCHLVERTRPGTPIERRRYVLKVQLGKPVPEAKEGADIGIDYGIRNTVTTSTGKRLQRPETGALEDEARALRAYARGRCKKRSRRYQDLYREAKKLSRKIARIHDNWEREAAKTLCAGTAMIAREDLKLRNMIASGAGTPSAPGSNTKKGLNRELNRARIGHLDRRVERRAVRTGINTVVVHPGNTSITCSKCGHKDRESRKGPVFECTKCGYQTDADWNAAINIKGRGHNIFSAWKATRERGRAGRSFRREAGEEAGPGQREKAARGAPLQASPNACHLPQNTTGDAKAPP